MTHPHQVTDRAILRYLELVYGFNSEFFRNRIAVLAERGIKEGATGVIIEGVKLVIRDSRVVNVTEKQIPSCARWSIQEPAD
ncbi:Hypothetical protein NGAL_HAMBI1145_09610 [Neorhizobium galegae bv. officinalis]|uniref:Uncharacterized protein n=1 Tax=Neorhizobium galegae bv. officinalis TaxID=323656 RepID=A0A0T7FAY0_NEOGA|nr:hypothetical protein [Neorhizobium galegae]CDZ32190.1 Hypothetical protein NGAL_HAMBI1145_09610 [Neorhizobium galegae bv. officinalis]